MQYKCPHDEGEDILQVDKFRLDEAWLSQPRIYNYYAEQAADARRKMDEAKAKLELVKAELSLHVRSEPGDYGLAKVTENIVDAAVTVNLKTRDATNDFFQARHDYDVLQGLLTSLDHKKKALEKLVDLQGRDYFSEPIAPKQSRERMEKVEKKAVRGGGRKRRTRVSKTRKDDE